MQQSEEVLRSAEGEVEHAKVQLDTCKMLAESLTGTSPPNAMHPLLKLQKHSDGWPSVAVILSHQRMSLKILSIALLHAAHPCHFSCRAEGWRSD